MFHSHHLSFTETATFGMCESERNTERLNEPALSMGVKIKLSNIVMKNIVTACNATQRICDYIGRNTETFLKNVGEKQMRDPMQTYISDAEKFRGCHARFAEM